MAFLYISGDIIFGLWSGLGARYVYVLFHFIIFGL